MNRKMNNVIFIMAVISLAFGIATFLAKISVSLLPFLYAIIFVLLGTLSSFLSVEDNNSIKDCTLINIFMILFLMLTTRITFFIINGNDLQVFNPLNIGLSFACYFAITTTVSVLVFHIKGKI